MSGVNPLKRLRAELDSHQAPQRPSKSNRTLSLTEPQFRMLQAYCQMEGIKVSEVIDRLIGMYLAEVKDDLPVMLSDDEKKPFPGEG